MTTDFSTQASLMKQRHQEQITIARQWVDSGSVRDDSTFEDEDGRLPFQGCLERLTERTKEMGLSGERWGQETLAFWCKKEADVWFDGFSDDRTNKRMDFAASLYSLAKHRLEFSNEALSPVKH